jgi:hypothetical protein
MPISRWERLLPCGNEMKNDNEEGELRATLPKLDPAFPNESSIAPAVKGRVTMNALVAKRTGSKA